MKRAMCIILVLVAPSCAISTGVPLARLGNFDFGYTLQGNAQTNVIQVFDNGKETYVHFLDLQSLSTPTILKGKTRTKLNYRKEQNFAVLNGVYDLLRIEVGKKKSFAKKDPKSIHPQAGGHGET